MLYKLRKIGNSWGVILPKHLVKTYLDVGKIDLVLNNKEEALIKELEFQRKRREIVASVRKEIERGKDLKVFKKPKPKTCPKHHLPWSVCGCVWK